jgi:hypothetical protein
VASAVALLLVKSGVTLTRTQFLLKLTVTDAVNSDLVAMTFKDTNPAVAQVGANAELRAYETEVRTSLSAQIESTISNIDQAVANLSTRSRPIVAGSATDQLRRQLLAQRAKVVALRAKVVAANGGTDPGISASSPAALPTAPTGTSIVLPGLIGAVFGLLLSGLAAFGPSTRGWNGKRRRRVPDVGMA